MPLQLGVPPTGAVHGEHEAPQLFTELLLTHWSPHRCVPAGQSQVAFHSQLSPQLCEPVPPHTRVAPESHVFSSVHADHAPY